MVDHGACRGTRSRTRGAAAALFEGLRSNTSLEALGLEYCGIGAAGAKTIGDALSEGAAGLAKLDVQFNSMGDEAKQALGAARPRGVPASSSRFEITCGGGSAVAKVATRMHKRKTYCELRNERRSGRAGAARGRPCRLHWSARVEMTVVQKKRARTDDEPGAGAVEADEVALAANPKLAAERRRLPIWEARQALLAEVAAHPTLVLIGETGCGKTTQIPQFLLAAGYGDRGVIGCTQPRRVAAMSVAKRVAEEMGVEVGSRAGYCVRFDDCSTSETRIRYVTDGMLLREAVADPSLRRYSVVIVDEAHERSLQTDMMLAILKRAQESRAVATGPKRKQKGALPPLKLLVMSATLETATFCTYFGNAPAVQVAAPLALDEPR